jgi:hypothetical protein
MVDRELQSQGWSFLEELVKAGGVGDQHEIGEGFGWDFETGEWVAEWLQGEGFIKRFVGGGAELLHPGRMWLKTKSLREARGAAGRRPSVELNQIFEGTVGAVLTGEGASATVAQSLQSDGQKVALAALAMLGTLVEHLEGLPGSISREGVLKLVAEGEREVRQGALDVGKLTRVAGAIASAIQTTASLQGAWAAVQQGLKLLGVNVP